ncbi:MAG: hypothetical protein A2Z12_04915 [Actinobacteria bacterium RBG_16_68_21]|nr:MAG: hypothetical protein A2Z12_04915 [Actinobacteria bacterium RBG_16_68_21]
MSPPLASPGHAGWSPILIGALVVGLGTSAPELLVSTLAATRGQLDLALGNVVGSNVANVTLVLGTAALITPIASRINTVRREGLMMFVALVVLAALLWNLSLSRLEALGLVAGMAVAALLGISWARRDDASGRAPEMVAVAWRGSVRREAFVGAATLAMTVVGADLLVRGASRLAESAGISSAFVGLVIVSVGTSLPELATALLLGVFASFVAFVA